ncbi:alpha/beta hydrolase [Pseudosulfitobacter pseudonitzschiae]|uniref:Alpha/beta hydrolase n=1 Tax=Pseudosulfitobacter pseudonitzschiae TaxID=1402135 RepID=A0A073J2V9_9RHOB|nr:alpha/beta hydrolase [Pseudosulfitobacter pseudonitzschiae]KEJ96329.1 alpha/beta hydrolase [Pseudosulfitobacter pseudonitzschiae]QKS08186.1 alpha/beta hydrolase [Pseudosulfitobacter pseudonitzschiae]
MTMQAGMRDLNGQPFYVRTWGDPALPRLLLLHGFPEYGGAWDDFAPLLAERYHVIAPDQRGYGRSWAPADVGAYTASALVSDMVALIGDDGPVTVLGHDWGAGVAYALAFMDPELVSRLIIANGVHPAPFQREMAKGGRQSEASQYINYLRAEGSEDRLAANDFEKLIALFSAKMDMSWLKGDVLARYKEAWGRPGRLRGMINWYRASPLVVADPGVPVTDLRPMQVARLQVRCPHLLIWAAGDVALMPEATEGLEEYAPDLTRVEIADADHWLFHQKPHEIAGVVLDWLEQV